jgi:two-component response regulator (ARR-A family)
MDCHHTGTGRHPHRHSPPCHLEASQEALSSVPQEMRVLAVDDNNIDRKLIEMLLKTSSFKVTAVKNAVKALEVLGLSGTDCSPRERLEYDLIMTDYCMPEMTGYELLRRIKHESSVWKHVPVVIMSSENKPARINRCVYGSVSMFLPLC